MSMIKKILKFVLAATVGAVCFILLFTTVPKIYSMVQIKGWFPGGVTSNVTITDKWHRMNYESQDGREAYFIAWNGGDIRTPGDHRTNLFQEQWEQVNLGETIEVVHIPGTSTPYLRNDIYVSFGNFVFDFILLILELLGVRLFYRAVKETILNYTGT